MATLANAVFDAALTELTTNGTRLDICSSEPTTYTEATSTNSLGNKTTLGWGSIADGSGGNGRAVSTNSFTDGTVSSTGSASHWAITDGTSALLATGSLSSTTSVTSGNDFSLGSLTITMTDPA
jgi:hypothetical protein